LQLGVAATTSRLATGGGGMGDEADEWRRQSGEREEWEEQVKRLPLNGCGEDREHRRKWGAAPLLVFCERRSGACWSSYNARRPRKISIREVIGRLLETASVPLTGQASSRRSETKPSNIDENYSVILKTEKIDRLRFVQFIKNWLVTIQKN
jgi:hypothetical protein